MKLKLKSFIFIFIVAVLLLIPSRAYASGITLDGEFSDWSDKPSMSDPQGDNERPSQDLILLKWLPDPASSFVYFFCQRANNDDDDIHNKFEDWNLTVDIDSGSQSYQAEVSYHAPSQMVSVVLRDAAGNMLWISKNNKWGEEKIPGDAMEFGIPFDQITLSPEHGYSIDVHIRSGSDMVPDSGTINMSTISSFPYATAAILGLGTCMGVLFFLKKEGFATFLPKRMNRSNPVVKERGD